MPMSKSYRLQGIPPLKAACLRLTLCPSVLTEITCASQMLGVNNLQTCQGSLDSTGVCQRAEVFIYNTGNAITFHASEGRQTVSCQQHGVKQRYSDLFPVPPLVLTIPSAHASYSIHEGKTD